MVPPPTALGLTICEKVIVERETQNVTLVSSFTKLVLERLSAPPRFAIYAAFTDGAGHATIELVITRLDTNEDIYSRRLASYFPDKLAEVRVHFRIGECSFPAPGPYQAALLVDGEWVAQRRFHVAVQGS